jgi:hypothetical protein
MGLGLAAGSAQAFVVDTKLGSADLGNSSNAAEEAALEALVGSDLVFDTRFDQGTSAGFNIQADGAGQWYIDVSPATPGYFVLKFGTGSFPGVDDTYFFQNIIELDKLVFTDAQVNNLTGGCGRNNCNEGRLSHYSLFNDDTLPPNEAPEPSSVFLAGLALLGAGVAARRRKA